MSANGVCPRCGLEIAHKCPTCGTLVCRDPFTDEVDGYMMPVNLIPDEWERR